MTYFTCSLDLVSLASFTVVVNCIVLIFPSILIKKHAFFLGLIFSTLNALSTT